MKHEHFHKRKYVRMRFQHRQAKKALVANCDKRKRRGCDTVKLQNTKRNFRDTKKNLKNFYQLYHMCSKVNFRHHAMLLRTKAELFEQLFSSG